MDSPTSLDVTPPELTGDRRYRWAILALVWFPYAAFGLLSRSIAPLVTPILTDLEMTYSQMGLVLGSWQLTYIAVGTVAGSFTDRFGVRRAVFAGTVIISLSAALRYFANGFVPFLLTVALFGVGAPLISIGAPTAISQWFSGKTRAAAVSIYTTSPIIGGLVALAATNSLVMPLAGYSWRLTFVYYALVTFVIALVWLFWARDAGHTATGIRSNFKQVFLRLLNIRNTRILFLCGLLAFTTSHGLTNWLPQIFEIREISATQAGFLAAVPMIVGLPAVLVVPALVPRRLRAKSVAVLAVTVVISLLLISLTSGTPMLCGLITFGIASLPIFPLLILMLMDTPQVSPQIMGLASGVFFAVSEIGGFTGPILIGTLFDHTGSFLSGVILLAGLNVVILGMTFLLKAETALGKPDPIRHGQHPG